jgi:hypothetical protein
LTVREPKFVCWQTHMCSPQLRGRNYTVQIMTNPTPCFVESSRRSSQTSHTIISVRGGGLNVGRVRDLRSTVERENAAAGIFVDKKTPSRPVRTEASAAGPTAAGTPRIESVTSADLIAGKDPVLAVPIQVGHTVSVGVEPESA